MLVFAERESADVGVAFADAGLAWPPRGVPEAVGVPVVSEAVGGPAKAGESAVKMRMDKIRRGINLNTFSSLRGKSGLKSPLLSSP